MAKKFKNDTSKTRLGDNFHYLNALELCINATEGDLIYLEQRGDLATEDKSIEIKHHFNDKHKLNDTHIDFWKTLKNWVENYEVIKEYKFLILLTTSQIQKDAELIKWNNSTKENKLKSIKKVKNLANVPSSIEPFVNKVFDFNKTYTESILLEILDKFTISHSEPTIDRKIEEVLKNPFFNFASKARRKDYLNLLISYIVAQGRDNVENWHIEISNFKNYAQTYASSYTSDIMPIPDLYSHTKYDITTCSEYQFVKSLQNINLEDKINEALNDYFRTQEAVIYLQSNDCLINKRVSKYQDEIIYKDISNIKEKNKLEIDDFENIKQVIKKSQKTYYDAMLMPLKPVEGYNPNRDFFQKGTIHSIVNSEDNDFTWEYIIK